MDFFDTKMLLCLYTRKTCCMLTWEVHAMEVRFVDPGAAYMIESILAFQGDEQSDFWAKPLYHFYPQLDRTYAAGLPTGERMAYIRQTMRGIYDEMQDTIAGKITLYSRHWAKCQRQITAALSDAFQINCADILNDLRCDVSLNPISPRFLQEHRFEVFYLNSERGAIGSSIHEIIHFVWFHVWHQVFQDGYDEYETPSLQWILSEMVVESIMRDERLSSINPYFPRENGGCIYPYYFDLEIAGKPFLDTLDELYRSQDIATFMRSSYALCQKHEAEIREHIRLAEQG